MRASVHVDLPGWTKDSIDALKARCEVLSVQPRGTRGESGGQTGKQLYFDKCKVHTTRRNYIWYLELQI